MSLADVLHALAETGATPAQLVAAVRAEEAAQARAAADASERRRAKAAQRQRNKRLRDAVQAEPQLPFTADPAVTAGHAESRGVTDVTGDSPFLPPSVPPRPPSTTTNLSPDPPIVPPAPEVGGEGATPVQGEAAELFEAAWRAYPHAKGRSSRPRSLAEWRKLDPAAQAALPAAVARYRAEGREPRRECGAKAFELWLADDRFLDWMGEGGGAAAAVAAAWPGPAALRAEIAAAAGEDFARAYLDPAGWRDDGEGDGGEILPRTGTAAERLDRELRKLLARRGVTITRDAAP